MVVEVFVGRGQLVEAGDPLFRIDTRELEAERKARRAEVDAAEAELARLRAAPRPEDIPPARATVEAARAMVNNARVNFERNERLMRTDAGVQQDLDTARYTYESAKATLDEAEAQLDRILAGTWEEDLKVAEAKLESARSQVERIAIEIDRRTVCALVSGEVLQLNVRPGQFAALLWNEPLVVLGNVEQLHVRVDIDEQDIPYFEPGAEAVATLKGRPGVRFPLEFVRVEPYVVPKRSLTGDNSERVDTRVLQVIYALPDDRSVPVYVGQQMDVYLRASIHEDLALDASGHASRPFEE